MIEIDVTYVSRLMMHTIIHKTEYQAKEMAIYFSIDLEQFKEKHSEELLFELLKK